MKKDASHWWNIFVREHANEAFESSNARKKANFFYVRMNSLVNDTCLIIQSSSKTKVEGNFI